MPRLPVRVSADRSSPTKGGSFQKFKSRAITVQA